MRKQMLDCVSWRQGRKGTNQGNPLLQMHRDSNWACAITVIFAYNNIWLSYTQKACAKSCINKYILWQDFVCIKAAVHRIACKNGTLICKSSILEPPGWYHGYWWTHFPTVPGCHAHSSRSLLAQQKPWLIWKHMISGFREKLGLFNAL